MIIKIYRRKKEIIVAACDNDLLGKKLHDGNLKLHVSPGFYGIDTGTSDDLICALRECTTANLVGKETISAAIDAGFIDDSGVIYIQEVPHAQLFKIL